MVATASRKTSSLKRKNFWASINLPLLTSLACHGLFFLAILPKLQLNSNGMGNGNSLSSTPVIELNSIEQTRLPDLTPPNLLNWDNIYPLPNLNSQLPNLPQPNFPLPDVNTNSFQFPLINNSNSAIANLPPPPSIPSAPIYRPNYPLNLNLPQPPVLLPPPPLNSSAIADLPPSLDLDNSTKEKEAEIREKLFPVKPEKDNSSPRELINSQTETVAKNPNSTPPLPPQPEKNSQSEESTVAMTSPPIKPSYQKLSQSLQKEDKNTSDENARKNYVAFTTDVKAGIPKEENLQGVYPRDACIRRLEGTTTYGVTVNAQGKVTDTKLIKSSGYPVFNNQALKQIQGRNFANKTGTTQAYHVYVNFKYNPDICPSLSLSNLGKFPPKSPPPTSTPVDSSTPKNLTAPPNVPPKTKAPSQAVNESKTNSESEVKISPATPKNNNDTSPVKLPIEVKNQPETKPINSSPTPPKQPTVESTPSQPTSVVPLKPIPPLPPLPEKPSSSVKVKPLPPLPPLPEK